MSGEKLRKMSVIMPKMGRQEQSGKGQVIPHIPADSGVERGKEGNQQHTVRDWDRQAHTDDTWAGSMSRVGQVRGRRQERRK